MSTPPRLPICDDCAVVLTEDTTAPSCGAHDICVDCIAYWTCRGCLEVWRELEDDLRQDHDNDYTQENS